MRKSKIMVMMLVAVNKQKEDDAYVITPSHTVKPVLSGHLKIDKTQVLMENGSLM